MARHTRISLRFLLLLAVGLGAGAFGCAGGSLDRTSPDGDDAAESPDAGGGADETGGSGCGEASCELGERRCAGPKSVVRCVTGPEGCGSFTMPTPCPGDQTCESGRCVDPKACVDMDGDGYGERCAKGPDCDDQNADIHPGAGETCGDGIDNDCAGEADDGCAPSCDNQPCQPGQARCDGDRVQLCEADAKGCGQWTSPMPCPGGGQCQGGRCDGCMDGDGDGYGPNCGSGGDCNDSNPDVHLGARELCDGVNNDCDGQTDEGFPRKGSPCSVGDGVCRRDATYRCNAAGDGVTCPVSPGSAGSERCGDAKDNDCDGQKDEGFGIVGQACTRGMGVCQTRGTYRCHPNDPTQTSCDAPSPKSGSREVCDGKDNDCDGQKDEGGVCTTCVEDSYEPNQKSTSATPLTSAKTLGELNSCGPCGTQRAWNWDWYYLGRHSPGERVRVELRHPTGKNGAGEYFANLDVEMYCGASLCDSIRGTGGRTSTTFDGRCGACSGTQRWAIHVYPRCGPNPNGNPQSGTPYSLKRY